MTSLSSLKVFDASLRRYVSARDLVGDIRMEPKSTSYLDRVLAHNRVTKLTAEFARIANDDRLAEPPRFVEIACSECLWEWAECSIQWPDSTAETA